MILDLSHVCKTYNGSSVIDDLSFSLDARERTAILGASGQGKTTLLKLILGLTAADSGNILVCEDLHRLAVFQEDRLLMSFNALDNLNVYPYPFMENEALSLLSRLKLTDAAHEKKPAREYSGGMKRRLAIARALYGCIRVHTSFPDAPLLLVMDEPFKGLDPDLKAQVISTTDEVLNAAAAALLLVTHDEKEAAALNCSFLKL